MEFSKWLVAVVIACFAGTTTSCAQATSDAELESRVQAEVQAQRDLAAEFDAAVNSRDLQRFLALFAADAVRLPPGSEPVRGKDAIGETMAQFFEEYEVQHVLDVLDVGVSGDVAYSRGTWRSTNTLRSGGEPVTATGMWTTIRERQLDGSWKTVLEIWNLSNSPD